MAPGKDPKLRLDQGRSAAVLVAMQRLRPGESSAFSSAPGEATTSDDAVQMAGRDCGLHRSTVTLLQVMAEPPASLPIFLGGGRSGTAARSTFRARANCAEKGEPGKEGIDGKCDSAMASRSLKSSTKCGRQHMT